MTDKRRVEGRGFIRWYVNDTCVMEVYYQGLW